jgi:hypothetical protein
MHLSPVRRLSLSNELKYKNGYLAHLPKCVHCVHISVKCRSVPNMTDNLLLSLSGILTELKKENYTRVSEAIPHRAFRLSNK